MSKEDRALYDAIYRSMWYWGNRIIRGRSANASNVGENPGLHTRLSTTSHRRRYKRLRAQGLTSYEVKAIMRGQTVERVQAETLQRSRDYRAKWGGSPKDANRAWIRLVLSKHGLTLEGDPYRGEPARSDTRVPIAGDS